MRTTKIISLRKPSRSARRFTLATVTVLAILCCTGWTWAADGSPTSQGWGVKLFSHQTLATNPTVAWSPDGEWLAYVMYDTSLPRQPRGIWIMSSKGGTPKKVMENTYYYTYQDKQYNIAYIPPSIVGFSPDNRYLYFFRDLIDESRGTIINFRLKDSGGTGCSLSNTIPVVDRLDLKTGEVVEIAEGYYCASLSRSGKYLVYGSGLNKQIVTRNLETGETWTISERCKWHSLCITPDDKYVIYSESISGQLFQVPITGGTPVQLTIYEKSIGETRLHPSCSADGRWVLYENVNNTRISCPITQPDGSVNTYWFMQSGFFAFNLETKKSFKLFPVFDTAMPSTGGVFSPDGSQFAYILNDLQNWEYALYIHDFTPEALPDGTVTSIAEALPTGFAITGNHPNPFNPSTTISFGLPSSGTASLAVYDITGRKVRELAAGRMTAGAHSTVWDGRDASGRAVSSGVYFARLSIGGAATTHRMMLMK